ncbi:malonate decarboxylase subunit alpha [Variovorax ureilyticus]|uniref:Acetate CoA-transferase YdiF n=1 Tax=Variovorax ureilyticus TaxID=1836198 RepID=A0ABU8VPL9_9BURK
MKAASQRVRQAARVINKAEAARLVQDQDCVYIAGSGGGHGVPEAFIDALRDRFDETGSPQQLKVVGTVSIGDWESTGFNKLADPKLVRRIVASGLNNCPMLGELAVADEIEAYTMPQGALAQLCREMAGGRPGLVTKTGLHTFVDPRQAGGRQSPRSKEDLVKLLEIEGEEFLFYRSFPIDVAVIRGTVADERGNISMEDEAFLGETLAIAAASRLRGGIVIAQVQRLAAAGSINPREVKVPGTLVDYIVVAPDQRQTYQTAYNPAYAGKLRVPESEIPSIPFDIRKVIARRAAMELFPGAVVNLGIGVSNGVATVAAEEGFYRDVTLTNEQGIIGGLPAVGKDAGAGINYDMLAQQPDQFDMYDGGILDIAFLSSAEVDQHGNVNVSRFGKTIIGPGGFINISQGARKVVFSGTMTTGGLQIGPDGKGSLVLEREGKVGKWVQQVQQITFNGKYARERGQEVMFVTDRAVFALTDEGVELIEVAPGISMERDVLDQLAFPVRVSPNLKLMDARLFRPERMQLAGEFHRKSAPSATKSH